VEKEGALKGEKQFNLTVNIAREGAPIEEEYESPFDGEEALKSATI